LIIWLVSMLEDFNTSITALDFRQHGPFNYYGMVGLWSIGICRRHRRVALAPVKRQQTGWLKKWDWGTVFATQLGAAAGQISIM
jgi:hypothetical protein